MRLVLISVAVLLTGCATVDDVRRMSSGEVCYRVASGNTQGLTRTVFYNELERRGENCSRYQAAIANQMRADAADTATGISLIQSAQPRAQQSTSISCSSYKMGNTIQTDCR